MIAEESRASDGLLRSSWSRISPFLWEYKTRVVLALGTLLLGKGALLLVPFILKALVDSLELGSNAGPALALLALVLAYGGARFSSTLFSELRDLLFGRVTEHAMRRLGLQVFNHVHTLDLRYHLQRRTGGLARDIERGISGISFLMRFFVFNIAPTLLEISMVAGILLWQYGIEYSAVVLAAVAVYITFSFRATAWRTRFVREVNEADTASTSRAVDSFLNYETVKYFNAESLEAQRFDQELGGLEAARRKNRFSLFTLNSGQAIIIACAQGAMLAMAAFEVRAGSMSVGDFVLVNQFMIQLFLPLSFLGFLYREIKSSLANIERLFALLNLNSSVVDKPDAQPLASAVRRIAFDNVSFAYESERPILKNVSFEVSEGETVAIVGPSGAGKSTLLKLLMRFYDPDAGSISFNQEDLRDLTQNSVRQTLAVVPQDCVLFNDSLSENLRYGDPDASDGELAEALRIAHLSRFVSELPDGLETVVGERGLKLSGGEKQRVGIARAVLKSASLVIFDEATSSLDLQSEQVVLAALRELAQRRTTLLVTHRLTTVVDADRILVLDNGRLVEQGRHQALLELGGVYAGLWHSQPTASRSPDSSSASPPSSRSIAPASLGEE
ncbi:MAG: ABC transporter ATP-binding protein/permease [Pseudomonadota bacterium]